MKKRIVAALLAGAMVFSLTACGGGGAVSSNDTGKNEENGEVNQTDGEESDPGLITATPGPAPKDAPVGGQFVVGITPGSLSPDMMDGWSANATNREFQKLMDGYGITCTNRDRILQWDDVVVEKHDEVDNEDGSRTYTVKLNENLKWSDGSKITAKDYLFNIMYRSSTQFAECEADATAGNVFTGYEAFRNAEVKEFKGLHLLGEYEFSLEVAAEELPNYFVLGDIGFGPAPMAAIAPGTDIIDDGDGCYFNDKFTTDVLRETLLDPEKGFRYQRPVVCGPYKLKKMDLSTETVELEINKEYLGTYDGAVPHVASIISKAVPAETLRDEFEKGTVDFFSSAKGETIDATLSKIENGDLKVNYGVVPMDSVSEWRFCCDFGPSQFSEVRRAFAYIIDRDEINKQLTGGYASVVDCLATEAMTDYQETKDELEGDLIHYSYDLDKAKQELIDGGWTLNEKGEDFVEGTDKIRYKEVDGELMKLSLNWSYMEGEATTLYNTVVPPEAEKIGMEIKGTKMDFSQMINHINREGMDKPTYHVFTVGVVLPEFSSWWYFFDDAPERMGLWNYYRVSDKELKEITAKMKSVEPGDVDTFRKYFVEFEKEINHEMPGVVMTTGTSYWFVNPKLKNFVPRAYDNWSYMVLDSYIEE